MSAAATTNPKLLTMKINPKNCDTYDFTPKELAAILDCIKQCIEDLLAPKHDFSFVEIKKDVLPADYFNYIQTKDFAGKIIFNTTNSSQIDDIEYSTRLYPKEAAVVEWYALSLEYVNTKGRLATDLVELPTYVHPSMNNAGNCHIMGKEFNSFNQMFLRAICFTIYEVFCPEKCYFECSHPDIVEDLVKNVKTFAEPLLREYKKKEEKVGGKVKRDKKPRTVIIL